MTIDLPHAVVGSLADYSTETVDLLRRLASATAGLEFISESDSDVLPIVFRSPRVLREGPASLTRDELAAAMEPIASHRPMKWEEWHTSLETREIQIADASDFLADLAERDDDGERWQAIAGIFDGRGALIRLGTDADGDDVMGTVDVLVLRQTGPDEIAGIWLVSIET
jgi:hypothetical protein